MTAVHFEHSDQARAALQAIVSDPEHGVNALASAQTMTNLLNDLLPDAPRETGLIVAAVSARMPDVIRGHVAQGLDVATATSLAAASLQEMTAFTVEACGWVVTELAIALGLRSARLLAVGAADHSASRDRHPGITSLLVAGAPESQTAVLATTPPLVRPRVSRKWRAGLISATLVVVGVIVVSSFALGYRVAGQHTLVRIRVVNRTKTLRAAPSIPCQTAGGTVEPGVIVSGLPGDSVCTLTLTSPMGADHLAQVRLTARDGETSTWNLANPYSG